MAKEYKLVAIDEQRKELELNGKKFEVKFYNDQIDNVRVLKVNGNIDRGELGHLADHLKTHFPTMQFLLLQEFENRTFDLFRFEEIKDKRPGLKFGKFNLKFADK